MFYPVMYARCPQCFGVLLVEGYRVGDECACGAKFDLVERMKPESRIELKSRASRLAVSHLIDEPTALSIALDLMKVGDLGVNRELPTDTPATVHSNPERSPLRYDRGFQLAIDDGHLTPLEAMKRGNRQAYANRLAKRHGLSRGQSLAVTDNRISLAAVMRKRAPDIVLTEPVAKRSRNAFWAPLAACLLATIAVGGFVSIRNTAGPPTRRAALETSTRVERNAKNVPIRIGAPDPRSVLIAFCDSAVSAPSYEPLGVTPYFPADPRYRLGLFRDLESRKILAIPIFKDRVNSRWSTGDGARPQVIKEAPAAAVEALLRN